MRKSRKLSLALSCATCGIVAVCAVPGEAMAAPAQPGPVPLASSCDALVGKQFGHATILEAHLTTGPTELNSQYGGSASVTKPMCRVLGQSKPTADSDIRFEVWLPMAQGWNHHYQAIGGGGNAGTFSRRAVKRAFDGGYAVSGQDNGHTGRPDDASFALGHPEKVVDFGWRSLHEVALASKAVIEAYYGQAPDLSLFNGCSTGGRQALALAQRFPADYDGISAGAPANAWPELNAISAKFGRFLMDHPDAWVSPAKLLTVQNAVQQHCGGIKGIIDDPQACTFDVSTLACAGEDSDGCLTQGEVAGLKARFADLVDDDGRLLYPSFSPGAEVSLGRIWMGSSRQERWYSSGAAAMPEGFFKDYVAGRSDWTIRDFEWKRDLQAARQGVIGKAVAAENPDLSAFAGRGGKLIQWHGWHDMAIPSRNSVRYYNSVVSRMGGEKVASFYRLFMGTGVDHCAGGPGPDSIGGGAYGEADADHDVMSALVRWLQKGQAPEQIIASKYAADGTVMAQRPWCSYPGVAVWDGKGDRNLAVSYHCPSAWDAKAKS
jgi:hypothetical protein